MKKYIKSFNDRDNSFQSDLNSAIYNAITEVTFKYRDCFDGSEACNQSLEHAVDLAVDWWSTHFFESDDWNV